MTRIVLIGVLLAAVGCGQEEAPSDTSPNDISNGLSVNSQELHAAPKDEATAIDLFQSQALISLPVNLTSERQVLIVDAINDREHLHARRATYEACFERIDGTLTAKERDSMILHGTTDDLRGDRSGGCWAITSLGRADFKMPSNSSIEGYLDDHTGKLLVLWIVPEG